MRKIFKDQSKITQRRRKCPKCGAYFNGYPALSRVDNKTKICPKCGTKEAILELLINR